MSLAANTPAGVKTFPLDVDVSIGEALSRPSTVTPPSPSRTHINMLLVLLKSDMLRRRMQHLIMHRILQKGFMEQAFIGNTLHTNNGGRTFILLRDNLDLKEPSPQLTHSPRQTSAARSGPLQEPLPPRQVFYNGFACSALATQPSKHMPPTRTWAMLVNTLGRFHWQLECISNNFTSEV